MAGTGVRGVVLVGLLAEFASAGGDVVLLSPLKQKIAQSIPASETWKVPLGIGVVEELLRLPGGRLYAGIRQCGGLMPPGECLIVDEATGRVLWRNPRTSLPGAWNLLLADADHLVFGVAQPGKAGLAVLDAASGAEAWSLKPAPDTRFVPLVASGLMVTVAQGKARPLLTALRIATGGTAWTRELDSASPVPPTAGPDGLLVFGARTECWRAADGSLAWSAPVKVAANTPRPVVDPGALWLVAEGDRLISLDPAGGKVLSSCALPQNLTPTNIYPLGTRLFLRGRSQGVAPYVTLELDPRAGKVVWSFEDTEPAISNLLEAGDRVLFATPSRVVAIDASGKAVLNQVVARVGKGFPNLLKPLGEDAVLFLGEAIVTALSPSTGRVLWRHGNDPLHQDAETDALLRALERAGQGVAYFGGSSGAARGSSGPDLAQQYQNEARTYFREWEENARRDPYKAEIAFQKAQISSAFSRAQSKVDFYFSMMEFQAALSSALNLKFHQEQQVYYSFIQQSLLKGYRLAETLGWVLRPTAHGEVTGVNAIQLPGGRVTFLPLGVSQGIYGLWTLPAPERGLIFHEGLRPSTKAASVPDKQGYRPYENHLMATPLPEVK
jgi:outer membrane protein assembly factor BamB